MRVNSPVTQNEYIMEDGRTIVSSTDLQGNINYANPYFIEASGFTEEELIGAPIDIISTGPDRNETIVLRHPFA